MFAVPGWSLGSERPATDTSSKTRKKKKKDSRLPDVQIPTIAKADSSLDGRPSNEHIKKSKKRKSALDGDDSVKPVREPAEQSSDRPPKRSKTAASSAPLSQSKPAKNARRPSADGGASPSAQKAAQTTTGALKLTPLQAAMQKKLLGARFRQLNESLYTSPSANAVQMFASNPAFFEEYHSGFRSQVDSWPQNPVDTFVEDLKIRGSTKSGKLDKIADKEVQSAVQESSGPAPLPRSKGKCTVADLGCGDAGIAKAVKKFSGKTGIHVQSFDLQSTSPLVTEADISSLPLADGTIDVAIFCLALMGTNWIDFIEEAWRVLHWKGELWVAEIKSRFGKMERKQTAAEKKKTRPGDVKRRKQAADVDEADSLIEDAAGDKAPGEKTDVSAFVGILKKRGFVMENERNIDYSNKMFVRMKFIKAVKPIKGKYKAQLPEHLSLAAKDKAWRNLLREDEEFDEASTLKPCLYKVR